MLTKFWNKGPIKDPRSNGKIVSRMRTPIKCRCRYPPPNVVILVYANPLSHQKKKGKENFDECDFHAIYFGTFVCVVLVKHLVESCETTGSKLRGLVCRQKVCRCLSHVGRVCWSRWERCGLGDPHSIKSIYTLVWGTIIDPFFLVGQPVSYHFKICV